MNNKSFLQNIKELFKDRNPGLVGASAAFAIAVLWLIFGFLGMLFILGMTLLGYFLGIRYFSHKDGLRNLLDKILPPGFFR
jgi:uncharacterized membrane protein